MLLPHLVVPLGGSFLLIRTLAAVRPVPVKPLPISICHQVPGRMRLRIPALRSNPDLGQQVSTALAQLPGIRDVHVNPACASVVLFHAPESVPDPELLSAHLHPLLSATSAAASSQAGAPGQRSRTSPCAHCLLHACALCSYHQRIRASRAAARASRSRALVPVATAYSDSN